MREKWNKTEEPRISEGQPVATKIVFTDVYRPKLLSKAPSMRAIKNYNNVSTAGDNETYDNLTFIPENEDIRKYARDKEYFSFNKDKALQNITLSSLNTNMNLSGHIYTSEDTYDYPTMRSKSSGTNTVFSSEDTTDNIRKDDLGSTATLVSPKIRESCRTCISYIETVLCTISLAAGIGNLYRLPLAVVAGGGFPFLVAYVTLVVIIGLPLLFLELGVGQIVQEGFMKTWRAVPFFRGIGYVKLLAGCLLSIYYPIYMGLSLYYLIWFAKGSPPFNECAVVKMGENGYKADGVNGQECLEKTFLASPFEDDLSWFGIFCGILLLIWLIVTSWCIKRSKTYEKALIVFLLCTVACLVALIIKAVETEEFIGIENFVNDINWDILKTAEVWYYAAIQVFFSTNIGFGIFVSNAGVIYKKVNPFWTSIGYIFVNLVLGVLSVALFYTVSHNVDPTPQNGTILEVHMLSHIYNVVLKSEDVDMQIWSVVAYMTILFAGFISMITIMYTIIKAISLETKNRLRWWQFSLIISFISFILGCAILLYPHLDILHLLDHYIVGNLILITVILEVFAFIVFYGASKLQSDFEFILGNSLCKLWIMLWYLCPIILLAILVWGLSTMQLTGYLNEDPMWVYLTGWLIVVAAIVLILIIGLCNVAKQEEYFTVIDKLKASFKHSRNWGPTDPMMRHTWVQWHSKAQDGERDFTLKRRGTKEYTHSVKNKNKYMKSYTPTIPDDASTISGTLTYKKGDQNQNTRKSNGSTNYAEPYYLTPTKTPYEAPLKITALVDAIDTTPVHTLTRPNHYEGYKTNYNPLAYINNTVTVNGFNNAELQNDGSTSEGYGTYRKGPYLIEDDGVNHVCHRRNSLHEQATEL